MRGDLPPLYCLPVYIFVPSVDTRCCGENVKSVKAAYLTCMEEERNVGRGSLVRELEGKGLRD
jgi:hypothetical protein